METEIMSQSSGSQEDPIDLDLVPDLVDDEPDSESEALVPRSLKTDKKHKYWCITVQENAWPDQYKKRGFSPSFLFTTFVEYMKADKIVTYFVCALEKGTQYQRKHIQAYMELSRPLSFLEIKCRFPWATNISSNACQPRKGTAAQARDYIKEPQQHDKEPALEFCEWGVISDNKQGKRNDLLDVYNKIKGGEYKSVDDVEEGGHVSVSARYPNWLKDSLYRNAAKQSRVELEALYCIYGDSNTGKSYACREDARERGLSLFEVGAGGDMRGLLSTHDAILFDDFSGELDKPNVLPLHAFKRILDKSSAAPIQVPYGQIYPQFKVIYFTSNNEPWKWYPNCNDRDRKAIWRRFTHIVELTGDFDADNVSSTIHPVHKPSAGNTDLPDEWKQFIGGSD